MTLIVNLAFYGCTSLTTVKCYAENVPEVSSYAFFNVPLSSATLYVPDASVEAYKSVSPWSRFGEILPMSQYVTGLSDAKQHNEKGETRGEKAYNLQGVPVGDSYKGIVIKNGKKSVRIFSYQSQK